MTDIYTRDNSCSFCKKADAQLECRNCFEGPICRGCVAEHTASGNWQGYFCLCAKPQHEMREIPICDGPYLDDEEAQFLATMDWDLIRRASANDPTLQVINLKDKSVSPDYVLRLLDALYDNTVVRDLYIERDVMQGRQTIRLGQVLAHGCTLQCLCLRNCNIFLDEFRYLTANIAHSKSLRHLDISANYMGGNGSPHIRDMLSQNTSLHTLILEYCGLYAEAMFDIATGLANNRTLRTLDMSHNDMTDAGADYMARALTSHPSLTSLDLGFNQLETKGACSIAEALKNNTCLTSLDLTNNYIGQDGCARIMDALCCNATLRTLSLQNNQICTEGSTYVANALARNGCLHKLNLGGNFLGPDGARRIAKALGGDTTLRDFNMQNNNILPRGQLALNKVVSVMRTRKTVYDAVKTALLLGLHSQQGPLGLIDREVFERIVGLAGPTLIKILF